MTLVVDASAVLSALIDDGSDGSFTKRQMSGQRLMAPQHMPAEVANVLRRLVLAGRISTEAATLAHNDLLHLRFMVFGYRGLGERVWELRANVSPFDAWYVALAEALEAPLLTLDWRLAGASGPRCEFRLPDGPNS
jgi:predicted nucleic acid-binding protein